MIRSTRSECLLGKNEISIAYLIKFIDVPVHITTSSNFMVVSLTSHILFSLLQFVVCVYGQYIELDSSLTERVKRYT